MTFGLGLAAVFMWQGLSLAWRDVPVDLPKTHSGDTIAITVPLERQPPRPTFLCDEFEDQNERAVCLDKVIFEDRDRSLYDDGGQQGCRLEQRKAARFECERSKERARRFIWDHWKKHKRGFVAVANPSMRGDWVRHLFIEQNADGKWRVDERTVPMLRQPEDPEHYRLGDLVEIEWSRATSEDKSYGLSPGTMYLRLSNITGDSLIL